MDRCETIEKAALAASVIIAVSSAVLLVARAQTQDRGKKKAVLSSTIAFVSTRHEPTGSLALGTEIYLMNGDGTNVRRLTENTHGDCFPAISPDGKTIVFDSNRLRIRASRSTPRTYS